MKHTYIRNVSRRFLLAFIASVFAFLMSYASVTERQVDSVLNVLDKEIELIPEYRIEKEQNIDSLRSKINGLRSNSPQRFKLLHQLFREYCNYQSDSATVYAKRMVSFADKLGDSKSRTRSKLALFEIHITSCRLYDAAQIHTELDPSAMDDSIKLEYYNLLDRLYHSNQFFVNRDQSLQEFYNLRRGECYDSILKITTPGSYDHELAFLKKSQLTNPDAERMRAIYEFFLERYNLSNHEKAIIHYNIGIANTLENDYNAAIYNFAQSTIYDIRSNTRENTSSTRLAWLMFERNKLEKAKSYVKIAVDDAEAYNSSMRIIDSNAIQARIDNARYDGIYYQRLWLIFGSSVLILLFCILIVLFRKLMLRNKDLTQLQSELVDTNNQLEAKNEVFSQLNEKLNEAIEIKDRYIMQSLRVSPDFVDDAERKIVKAKRKLVSGEVKQAIAILEDIDTKNERTRIYASFDDAFLKLFPGFLDAFNSLFPKDQHFTFDKNGHLPTEVRIFALMRLGVVSAVDIATFLNMSVGTVYAYMSKVRSRSLIENNQFNEIVLSISKR